MGGTDPSAATAGASVEATRYSWWVMLSRIRRADNTHTWMDGWMFDIGVKEKWKDAF